MHPLVASHPHSHSGLVARVAFIGGRNGREPFALCRVQERATDFEEKDLDFQLNDMVACNFLEHRC